MQPEKITNATGDENTATAEAEEIPPANVTDDHHAVESPTTTSELWTACPKCKQGPTTEQVRCRPYTGEEE